MGWSLRSCHGNLARLLPSIAALQTGRRFRHGSAHPQGILCFTSQFSRSTGGTDEAVIGSMGSHKGSLWHCDVGRRPAGLCAFVGHLYLCSLSWQLVTCQHCPNPCCTLRADRQQGLLSQERVLFLLFLFGLLCCSNKIYVTGQFI